MVTMRGGPLRSSHPFGDHGGRTIPAPSLKEQVLPTPAFAFGEAARPRPYGPPGPPPLKSPPMLKSSHYNRCGRGGNAYAHRPNTALRHCRPLPPLLGRYRCRGGASPLYPQGTPGGEPPGIEGVAFLRCRLWRKLAARGPVPIIAPGGLRSAPEKSPAPQSHPCVKRPSSRSRGIDKGKVFMTNTLPFFSPLAPGGGGSGGAHPPEGARGICPRFTVRSPAHIHIHASHSPPQGETSLPYLIIYRNNYGDLQNPLPSRGGANHQRRVSTTGAEKTDILSRIDLWCIMVILVLKNPSCHVRMIVLPNQTTDKGDFCNELA